MRVPTRKPGQYTFAKPDPHLTPAKYRELAAKLERLKKIRPAAAAEVKRLALDGDFSENAAYQIAKGRLRGLNQRIIELSGLLKRAVIIAPAGPADTVRLGATVTLESERGQTVYRLLGSAETDPAAGVISHNSPLGRALLGRRAGDSITIKTAKNEIKYRIVKIE